MVLQYKSAKLIASTLILLAVFFVSCKNDYEKGKELFNEGKYQKSLEKLIRVPIDDEFYKDARILHAKADSILKAAERKNFVTDSTEAARKRGIQRRIEASKFLKERRRSDSISVIVKHRIIEAEIERLKKALEDIENFNGSVYRGEVNLLVTEVALFLNWGEIAINAEESDDSELKKLGRLLEQNLKNLQLREFPKIRTDYTTILDRKLWESDIDVVSYGSRKTTLELTGGLFSLNRYIGEYNEKLGGTMKELRFKKVNYKWRKKAGEFTFYNLDPLSDSEIQLP